MIQLRNVDLSGVFGTGAQLVPFSIDFGDGVFLYGTLQVSSGRGSRH